MWACSELHHMGDVLQTWAIPIMGIYYGLLRIVWDLLRILHNIKDIKEDVNTEYFGKSQPFPRLYGAPPFESNAF